MHGTSESHLDDWATMVPWRRSRLRAAGFPPALAARLAADDRYDVRALLALTERGCPPGLAARIVAPLDAGDAR